MIVCATVSDAKLLTEIALKSKSFWNYSEDQIESWREDLTVTSKMFEDWNVYKFVIDAKITGFYILNMTDVKASVLEFLFVSPHFIKQGIGKQLLLHAIALCQESNCTVLNVLSDPNAAAFYARNGFEFIRERESSIPGRILPEMELKFSENR